MSRLWLELILVILVHKLVELITSGLLELQHLGYEPTGLTVHPTQTTIEGGFIFFEWVSIPPKFFLK